MKTYRGSRGISSNHY